MGYAPPPPPLPPVLLKPRFPRNVDQHDRPIGVAPPRRRFSWSATARVLIIAAVLVLLYTGGVAITYAATDDIPHIASDKVVFFEMAFMMTMLEGLALVGIIGAVRVLVDITFPMTDDSAAPRER